MRYTFFPCYSWPSTQCPISPYLFLLCAEIMGIANRRSEDIRGLKLKSKELKLSQYANDAQIVLGGSRNLIRNVVKLLDSDTALGGLKLNYNRPELAPLGKSKMEDICTHSFSPGMTIILDNYTDKWKNGRSYDI